ncbi:hypothetical protein I4U23_005323 [Adineta vaga]|nr:hypothetical protein I4U23_005323 [Adineta vaga]
MQFKDSCILLLFTPTSLTVKSNYSSALTISGSTYSRPESRWFAAGFFYEAIKINVAVAGIYTISSDSTMDTQGFIYNNSFNISFPNQNLMSFDDDGAGSNKQFILAVVLQATTNSKVEFSYSVVYLFPLKLGVCSVNANSGKLSHRLY